MTTKAGPVPKLVISIALVVHTSVLRVVVVPCTVKSPCTIKSPVIVSPVTSTKEEDAKLTKVPVESLAIKLLLV